MRKSEKRLILVLVLITVVAIIIWFNVRKKDETTQLASSPSGSEQVQEPAAEEEVEKYITKLDDGTKLNTSEEFNNSKTYKDLTISNIQYTYKDGMSVLLADVTNNGTETHEMEIVSLRIIDENGEEIITIEPVLPTVAPGDTKQLNASITADMANAKDFEIFERVEQ